MAVFKVETYVIKPEKQEEYMALVKKFVALKEKNPQKSRVKIMETVRSKIWWQQLWWVC